MKKQYRLNSFMNRLLIEEALDQFTVRELRDMAYEKLNLGLTPVELRVKLYRQLLALEDKGLLSTSGTGRNKRYFKTVLFNESFNAPQNDKYENIQSLRKEFNDFQGELEITLGEVEHYQNILDRFPDKSSVITPLKNKAKEQAAILLGKIKATSNVLTALEGCNKC